MSRRKSDKPLCHTCGLPSLAEYCDACAPPTARMTEDYSPASQRRNGLPLNAPDYYTCHPVHLKWGRER